MIEDEFADFILFYLNYPQRLEKFKDSVIHIMNEAFAIVHVPVSQMNSNMLNTFGYSSFPKLFGLCSLESIKASGVDKIRNIPILNLRGRGTLIGIIDTGIDYTNEVFLKDDQTTKIAAIWDQTIETGVHPYDTPIGTEYKADLINLALNAPNPYDIVPSRDENGHGTMMAAVAAGNDNRQADFYGVAPSSELVIVKLRQAKKYLRDFFMVSEEVTCFQENYIMWAVQYCFRFARELDKPIVICLGVGSSQGSHDGRSPLSVLLSIIGDFPKTAIVTASGNEGSSSRHFYSKIDVSIGYSLVELSIDAQDKNFTMELWGNSPGIFSIDILSPSGEYIPRIPAGLKVNRKITFIFEATTIEINYMLAESETGDQLILCRFHDASPGVWRFKVYRQGDLDAGFHIWLPMGDMISKQTFFIQSNIYTTILEPGNAFVPITITAYDPLKDTPFPNSGRGFTRNGIVKPDLAAPGVNYIAPDLNKVFTAYTGSGVAAAHTAGICSMLMEWAVIKGNMPDIDTVVIANYLYRGAKRSATLTYPNRDFGYGILDIFSVFDVLRSDFD